MNFLTSRNFYPGCVESSATYDGIRSESNGDSVTCAGHLQRVIGRACGAELGQSWGGEVRPSVHLDKGRMWGDTYRLAFLKTRVISKCIKVTIIKKYQTKWLQNDARAFLRPVDIKTFNQLVPKMNVILLDIFHQVWIPESVKISHLIEILSSSICEMFCNRKSVLVLSLFKMNNHLF